MPGFVSSISNSNEAVFALNADFSGSSDPSQNNGLISNGQIWIGSSALNVGGTHVNVGTLTSPDGSITFGFSSPNITAVVNGGASNIKNISGDTGTPITGISVTIFANQAASNAGKTVGFVNGGTVSTFNVTDADDNTAIGLLAGEGLTTGSHNTFLGWRSGRLNTSGSGNTGLGDSTLRQLLTGVNNVAIGVGAGTGYGAAESNNILLGNGTGTSGDNNTVRIGVQGNGAGQQDKCFIAGITGVTAVGSPMAVGSLGEISDLGFGTATEVLTSNGPGVSPTFQPAGGGSSFGFVAYPSANLSNVAGNSVFYNAIFDSTTRNDGTAYDTTTGLFTAPTTGLYCFNVILQLGSATTITAGSEVVIFTNDSIFGLTIISLIGAGAAAQAGAAITTNDSFMKQMVAGETIGITIFINSVSQDITVEGGTISTGGAISIFSGFRIG